jgi:hypothetical protein
LKKANLIAVVVLLSLGTATMHGQATRSWVSSFGSDANPCSRTAPCKTFAGALAQTVAGGEIDVLDPGSYGPVTISQAVTIDGGGQIASVLVSSGNGVVVQAGPNDVVILRNLQVNGIGAGANGIRFLSGKNLSIENCVIFGFVQNGVSINLSAAGTAHIVDSVIKNNGSCSGAGCTSGTGDGIFATTSSGTALVAVYNTKIIGASNNGVEAGSNSRITVDRSLVSASLNNGVMADGTAGLCNIGIDNSDILYGGNGTTASNSGCFVNVSHTTIAYNSGTAYNPTNGGAVIAFGTGTTGNVVGSDLIHDNVVGTPTKMNPFQ